MSLPYIFASLTTIVSTYWDSNFAALGALTPIPCSVSGTNALVMTPMANTPTVAAYQNYMQFTGIVQSTNSSGVTAQIGSLAALGVYKDTADGPVALTGGELVADTAFTLMYDATLDSGSGGFHIVNSPAIGQYLLLTGGTLSGALVGTTIALSGLISASTATISGGLKAAVIAATTGTISGLAGIGSLQVSTGATVNRLLTALSTVTFSSLNPQTTQDATISLTGVSVGDVVMAAPPSTPTVGLVLSAFVSASGSVVMRYANPTTSTLAPPSGAYRTTAIGAGP